MGGKVDMWQGGGAGVDAFPAITTLIDTYCCLGRGNAYLTGHVHPGAVNDGVAIQNVILWRRKKHFIF